MHKTKPFECVFQKILHFFTKRQALLPSTNFLIHVFVSKTSGIFQIVFVFVIIFTYTALRLPG